MANFGRQPVCHQEPLFDKMRNIRHPLCMKVVSVREMKANWAEIERQVAKGETFEVLNRGKPSVRIIPAIPRKVLKWDDHLATALPSAGKTGSETVNLDREGRW